MRRVELGWLVLVTHSVLDATVDNDELAESLGPKGCGSRTCRFTVDNVWNQLNKDSMSVAGCTVEGLMRGPSLTSWRVQLCGCSPCLILFCGVDRSMLRLSTQDVRQWSGPAVV